MNADSVSIGTFSEWLYMVLNKFKQKWISGFFLQAAFHTS